ncbi:regulator of telomere elongation helicase 1 [Babesia ovis]|uniref:Regulator of telomere elongation helicase 1 n=1 Tax=Babesia ovis TaxID=5869 RepID=A0A9W5T9C0_BABOV|nr:regulator of telomere elongation helicase 1 [Babesia ovis]
MEVQRKKPSFLTSSEYWSPKLDGGCRGSPIVVTTTNYSPDVSSLTESGSDNYFISTSEVDVLFRNGVDEYIDDDELIEDPSEYGANSAWYPYAFRTLTEADGETQVLSRSEYMKKRKPEIERHDIWTEAWRILEIYKKHGLIDSSDPRQLTVENIRWMFIQIDRMYKTPKIPLPDVFTRTLQQLVALPRMLKNALLRGKVPGQPKVTPTGDVNKNKRDIVHGSSTVVNGNNTMVNANGFSGNMVNGDTMVNMINWDNVKMQRNIAGIKVLFHFPTMQKPQIQLMAKLMHALKNMEHVVLESPTGTGKTAAILAGVFSWMFQDHIQQQTALMVENNPSIDKDTHATNNQSPAVKEKRRRTKHKVIYLTRTHAQIKQVMQAIKTSGFHPRSCSIASRLQLCIYKPSRNESDPAHDVELEVDNQQNRVNGQCRKLVANADKARIMSQGTCSMMQSHRKRDGMCQYYLNMGSKTHAVETALKVLSRTDGTWDIEDLIRYGTEGGSKVSLQCGCGSNETQLPQKKKTKQKDDLGTTGDIRQYLMPKTTGQEAEPASGICPYYAAKGIAHVSEFVVCPYNYILDVHNIVKGVAISQKAAKVIMTDARFDDVRQEIMEIMNEKTNLSGSSTNQIFGNMNDVVLVFDEGHNVEGACLEEASRDIKFELIKRFVVWMEKMRRELVPAAGGVILPDGDESKNRDKFRLQVDKMFTRLIRFLDNLVKQLYAFVSDVEWSQKLKLHHTHGERIFYSWDTYDKAEDPLGGSMKFIETFGLDIAEVYVMYCTIIQLRTFMRTMRLHGERSVEEYLFQLENMLATMVMLCHRPECYNVLILVSGTRSYTLGLWLMDPSAMFSELAANARNIVIASGTLAPIPAMVDSLGPDFERRLNGNILSTTQQLEQGQLALYTITHFTRAKTDEVRCDFANQKDERFQTQLGHSIVRLLEVMPGGTLIFFTSKAILTSCIEHWKETLYRDPTAAGGPPYTIYDRISMLKDRKVYQEPNEAAEFQKLLKNLHTLDKFVMFAVCRSHSSEGMNLKLSSLIMVGLPYPSTIAPRVDIARRYNKASGQKYNWYLRETFRAVNQAIGRCIRNKKDRGVIALMDTRYNRDQAYLPSWINPYKRPHSNVEDVRHDIHTNFRF